jgi:predicted Zn-dependent peptidase
MIAKFRLDNGLTLLLESIESSVSISAGLWIKSGSRNERNDQYGYAHFVEHMLFKGTDKYSAKDIARMVDRVGGQHNAATNREYTCYYINVISDHIELAVNLLSDMYYDSLFEQGELDKEKNIVCEEIRMYEDTPDEFIHDIFLESMFTGHPLSHSILGTYESIGGVSRDRILDFYKSHYNSSNSVFVIAGNFDIPRVKDLVEKYFSRKNGSGLSNPGEALLPQREAAHRHIDRDLEQVHFCLGTEGIKRSDEDRWALYVLSTILGGSMSSRLFQNIREREGISYSIYSFHSSYSDNGVFGIYCATTPVNYERAMELILSEVRDILNSGINEEELELYNSMILEEIEDGLSEGMIVNVPLK